MEDRDIAIANLVVGDTEIQIEVPKNVYDLVSLYGDKKEVISTYTIYGGYIESMLRAMLPDNIKPSTAKQIRFIRSIADTLNLDVSNDVLRNASAASKFIDENIVAFENKKNEEKIARLNSPEYLKVRVQKRLTYYYSKTITHQKYIKVNNLMEGGSSVDEIAEIMNVKPKTIESYLRKYKELGEDTSPEGILKCTLALLFYESNGDADTVLNVMTQVVLEKKLHLEDWFFNEGTPFYNKG